MGSAMLATLTNHRSFSTLLLTGLLLACSAPAPEATDFGSFFPLDAATEVATRGEVSVGEHLCFLAPEEPLKDLSVAGQVLEMSWDNLWPGNYIGDIDLLVFDWCGIEVDRVTVQPSGSFAFHTPAGEHGFVGYFEYPHRPETIAEADWEFDDYPVFREFDKEFRGDYIHSNLRLFDPTIISLPIELTKQKNDKGYIQGTLYEIISYDTLEDAVVTASSGKVTYLSESHLPDSALTSTRDRGLFLVSNTVPGPVELTVTLPSGNVISKIVYTWRLDSEPNNVITNVGFPVMPNLL